MRDVAIIGIGQMPVDEHWGVSLRHLAFGAARNALQDAGVDRVDAIYVGNMMSGVLNEQENLGTLVADFLGMAGVEAMKIEAACASGSAAVRIGMLAVASGMADIVLAMGVEKMTDTTGADTTTGLAMAADAEYEVIHGVSFVSLNAMLMRRYMYEYGWKHEDFANFPIVAHANAMNNPNALFHTPIDKEAYSKAGMIASPVNLLDSAPICDGAAAVILAPAEYARTLSPAPVRIRASAMATAPLAVHDRKDPLALEAAALSARRAYELARVKPEDIDFFELHDAFSIMSALSLEAAGFAPRGQGVRLALEGEITRQGRIPIATMGGLKARGHPVGATGVYQIVEAVLQLRGLAGANQLPNARLGMTQNIGGSGSAIVTHILEAMI